MKWSQVCAERELRINQVLNRPDFQTAYQELTGKPVTRRAAAKFVQGRGIVRKQGHARREAAA